MSRPRSSRRSRSNTRISSPKKYRSRPRSRPRSTRRSRGRIRRSENRRPPSRRSRKRSTRSRNRHMQYKGAEHLYRSVENVLQSITEKVDLIQAEIVQKQKLIRNSETELSNLRIEFKTVLQEFLRGSMTVPTEWYNKVDPDKTSAAINRMLFEVIGVGRSAPVRDPKTLQLIIDTLCKQSVPFTLQKILYNLSKKIPRHHIPPPSASLMSEFTDFWRNIPLKFILTLNDGVECVTIDEHMSYVNRTGDELPGNLPPVWKAFIRESLPEDYTITLEAPHGDTTVSWRSAFDKFNQHYQVEKDAHEGREQRIAATNATMIALALKTVAQPHNDS